MEIELKLVFTSESLDKLLKSEFFAERVQPGSAEVLNLVSTYYDTPEGRLRREGEVYRVRSTRFADGHYEHESTVKRTVRRSGAVAEREEVNIHQADDRPGVPGVVPLFVTEVERRTYLLEFGGAVFEMAIDRGRIAAVNGRTETIDEVEFELKSGDEAEGAGLLARLESALAGVTEFRGEERSKYARGLALLES